MVERIIICCVENRLFRKADISPSPQVGPPPYSLVQVVSLESLEVCVFSSKKTRRFLMIWYDLYTIVFSRLFLISTERCVRFVLEDKGLVHVLSKRSKNKNTTAGRIRL
jgi:hypothetical protein